MGTRRTETRCGRIGESSHLGIKYQEIANASAISDPDPIYPGQVLTNP
jgi:nucleoid-associated protein YgaU